MSGAGLWVCGSVVGILIPWVIRLFSFGVIC